MTVYSYYNLHDYRNKLVLWTFHHMKYHCKWEKKSHHEVASQLADELIVNLTSFGNKNKHIIWPNCVCINFLCNTALTVMLLD